METHPSHLKIEQSQAVPRAAAIARPGFAWDALFLLAVGCAAIFLVVRLFFLQIPNGDHYVYLAQHLTRGELWVDDIPSKYPDVVAWNGHKYLPFGPLPAILLMPFLPLLQLLGTTQTAWLCDLLTLLNIFIVSRILAQLGITDERRKWLLLLFFGGTVYFAAMFAGTGWYLAHIVTTTFLLLAISETLGKKRMWLVGIFLGLAGMARLTSLFSLPFFLWLVWRPVAGEKDGTVEARKTEVALWWRVKSVKPWLQSAALLVPLGFFVILLGLYNYVRFGNSLENGYNLAVLPQLELAQARAQGIFSLVHLPKNLFMLLLQGPVAYPNADAPVLQPPYVQPSTWGMGIFFTSPALLYIFKARIKEPLVQACWLAVVCVMLPIITYYGIGWVQFGYRYALDFMPFLVLLAAMALPKPITTLPRVLILVSVLVNLWGAYWVTRWL